MQLGQLHHNSSLAERERERPTQVENYRDVITFWFEMNHWGSVLGVALLLLLLSIPSVSHGAPPGAKDDCRPSEEDSLKLRSWEREGQGMVLVCRGGEWRRVCDDSEGWTKQDAVVTCRQLRYRHPQCECYVGTIKTFGKEDNAENLDSWVQGFANNANSTVPNCNGNEDRLSDCPALPAPNDCDYACAVVNCAVEVSAIITSNTQTTSAHVSFTVTKSRLISGVTTKGAPQATVPSLSLHPSPHISTALTEKFLSSKNPTESITNEEDDISNTVYNLNKLTITVIGGVTTALVIAGITVSVCLIACGVKKGRQFHIPKKGAFPQNDIMMQVNAAYVEQRQGGVQMLIDELQSEPIYENIH